MYCSLSFILERKEMITEIEGIIYYGDNIKSQFRIAAGESFHQWGDDNEHLVEAVDILQELALLLQNNDVAHNAV